MLYHNINYLPRTHLCCRANTAFSLAPSSHFQSLSQGDNTSRFSSISALHYATNGMELTTISYYCNLITVSNLLYTPHVLEFLNSRFLEIKYLYVILPSLTCKWHRL